MIKKIIANISKEKGKEKIIDSIPNIHLGIDRQMENASNKARTAINIYRNTDGLLKDPELERELNDPKNFLMFVQDDEKRFIEPQLRIAAMNENIIKYLNRSSQLLSSKLVEEVPLPKSYKEYVQVTSDYGRTSPYRQLDTILFASNMIMLTNSLDTNLFKQVASTVYDKYDAFTDQIKIPVNKLREQLQVEYKDIYEKLFENGLEEFKDILMPLRNTAGHSDIGQKISIEFAENPQIVHNGKRQDAYPIIQEIALAYLDKASKVYLALAADIDRNGKKPYMTDYMKQQIKKYKNRQSQ